MFVGVGAARMKHLFNMARMNKPCILFIDEIDSLGRKRDNSSYNSESNSVLNKFLVEIYLHVFRNLFACFQKFICMFSEINLHVFRDLFACFQKLICMI